MSGIKKFNAVQGFSVGESTIYDVIDNGANVTANHLVVNRTTNLGDIGNITITGGSSGYVLRTDGSGTLSWENPADVGVAGSNTQIQFNDNNLFGASANLTYNKTTKTLTVDNIVANGIGITNIYGPNVTDVVANANYAAYAGNVTINAQPNITSVGTLTSLRVTGNITSGNANLGNLAYAQYLGGTLTAAYAIQPNITSVGTLDNLSIDALGSVTGANLVSASYLTGVLTTKAQPNITSVGTLTTLRVTANITSGNANLGNLVTANFFTGDGYLLSNITGANVSGQVGNALVAGTVYTNSQPNITSVGTLTGLTVSGDVGVTGNLTVSGSLEYANVTTFRVKDPLIEQGGNTTGAALTSNDGYDRGQILHYYAGRAIDAFMGWDNSNAEFALGSNVSVTSEVVTFNEFGNLRVNYIFANASQLTGTIANANYATYAGTVLTNAQPNITSVGTLSSVNVSGNITSGNNVLITANVSANNANLGNLVTANYFTGNGSLLTSLTGANVTGWVPNANIANTVVVADQPNITSVGTLVSANVSGNITSGNNVLVTANISSGNANLGNLATANYFTGNGSLLRSLTGANVTGWVPNANIANTVVVADQPNITSVGILSSANVSGNITSGGNVLVTANISSGNANLGNLVTANYFTGNGSLLRSLTGANVTGWVPNADIANTVVVAAQPNITSVGTLVDVTMAGPNSLSGGNLVSANYITGTLTTKVQPNITSLGTLTGLAVSGDTTLTGNLTVTGAIEIANVTTFKVKDPLIEQGGTTTGSPLTSNDGYDRGQILHYYAGSAIDAFMGWDNSNAEFAFGSNVSVTNEVVTFNEFGNVRASTFLGNVVSSTLTGQLTTNNQPNITSVGTLSTLNVAGNITSGGNLLVTANVSASNANLGNLVTANYFTGNGSLLSSLTGANVTGWVPNANIANTVVVAAQPNITSVGTLVSANVSGNITSGGNLLVTANVSAGNANLGNLVTANYFTGTLTTALQPNITSLGSLSGLTVSNASGVVNFTTTANVTLGNVSNLHITGGVDGYVLKTDGAGNLAWESPTLVGVSGSNTQVQFNDNSNFAGSANFTFDKSTSTLAVTGQIKRNNMSLMAFVSSSTVPTNPIAGDEWYDRANDIIYKYIYDGTSYFWVDVSSGYIGANISAVGNTLVQRDTNANVTANYFIGNGSMLTGVGSAGGLSNGTSNINAGITNGNITVGIAGVANTIVFTSTGITTIATGGVNAGNLLTANYVTGTLTTGAQPNITSVGTLATTTMAANANIAMSGTLSQISGANLLSATYLTGTLTTAAQPNITSVGTLASLTVTANISSGNANLGNLITSNYYTGTLTTAAQPNITSTGTLASLTVTANISSGNANLGNLITSNYYTGTLTTASQPNITNVGSLTGLTVSNATGIVNFTTTANVTLGNVSNLHITGGTSGQYLQTNGAGGLSWATLSGSSISNGTSNINAGILNGNITVGIAGTANTVVFTSTGTNVAGYATITGNITGGNITSSGILSVTGNANVGNLGTAGLIIATGNVTGGNLTTAGQVVSTVATGTAPLSVTSTTRVANLNVNYANVADYGVVTAQTTGTFYPVFVNGNTTGNYAHASNTNINVSVATGAFNATLLGGTLSTAVQPNITSIGTLTSLTVTGNVSSGNANLGNLVTANFFSGAGNLLSNIAGGNVSGTVANANYAAYAANVTANAQPNITSTGTLTSLVVGGNITSGTGTGGNLVGANNISANTFTGNLTTAAQPNITSVGTLASLTVTGNITSGNANLGNLITANFYAGVLTTGAQPNITSTGTLAGLTGTGTINFTGASNVSLGSNTNVHITGGTSGQYLYTDGAGNLAWGTIATAALSNGTSNVSIPVVNGNVIVGVGGNTTMTVTTTGANITGYLTVTGNVSSGNANLGNLVTANFFSGAGNLLSNIQGANVSGQVGNSLVAGTVYTNAQPNITSVGTLSSLTVTGNISSGNANLGNLVTANFFSGAGNLLSNIQGANVSGQVGNALVAGTVYTNAQPNITSLGTLSGLTVSGDSTITGNLTVNGTFEYANVTSFKVKDPIIEQGGNPNGTALSSNDGYDRGQLLHYYSGAVIDAFMGWDNSNAEFAFGSNVSVTSEVVTFNQFGNIRAGYFLGNASQLTGTIANANYAAYAGNVTVNAQPNITSVGTLTSLNVTGNITGGNANLGNLVTANFFSGAGNLLSNIQAANITGTIANANYAAYAGNVTVNAQPNITSVGTLTSLNVTGNITSGGATGGNISGANNISANTFTGNLTTAAQPNITSTGTLAGLTGTGTINFTGASNVSLGSNTNVHITGGTSGQYLYTDGAGNLSWGTIATAALSNGSSNVSIPLVNGNVILGVGGNTTMTVTTTGANVTGYLTVTGNISSGNANLGNLVTANYFSGAGNLLSNIQGANVSGQVSNALVAGTVYTNAQPNITSVGTLSSLTVTGNITSGNANLGNLVTANYFTGNFYGTANNATTAGTVTTNAQPNITSVGTLSSLTVTANISSGNANLGNLVTANYFSGDGSLLTGVSATTAATVTTNAQPNITSVGTLSSLNVTGNVTSGNASLGNLVTANYFTGNFYGTANNATTAGTVTTNAQPNITSVGTLSSLTVTANISSGNANLGNLVTANFFNGSGNLLSNIQAANITGTVANANYAAYAGNITVNAQPNITSVGTLAGITATGIVDFTGASNVSLGSNANVHIAGGTAGQYLYTDGAGNLSWATIATAALSNGSSNVSIPVVNGNIVLGSGGNTTMTVTTTGANVTGYMNVTGNITSGNATLGNLVTANYFTGNGSLLTAITGANIIGTVANANYATYAGTAYSVSGSNVSGEVAFANVANNVAGANVSGQVGNSLVAGTVYTTAQPNITSVGTLSGLSVSGDTTLTGNLTVTGTFEYANVTSFRVKDPIIEQGGNTSGGALTSNDGYDRGQLLHYYSGSAIDAFMGWDNSNAEFAFGSNVSVTSEVVTFNQFGNVRASYFLGNGSQLTGVTATTATTAGTVTTNAQPNITSVGTLSSLTVTANVTSGNATLGNLVTANYFSGSGNLLSNIAGANVSGQVGNALVAGTVYTNAQPNITSVGTLSSLSVSGNVTSGNATLGNLVTANYFTGDGSLLTSITGANVTGVVGNASHATVADSANSVSGSNVTGQVGNALVAGTVYSNAQPNITSVGTLSSLNVTGNITAAYLVGNGSQLTGLPAGYANSNVDAYLPTYTGNISGNIVTLTGNITAINANLGNLVTANYFSGDGGLLSNITGSNVTGQVANAGYADYSGTAYSIDGANVSGDVSGANHANIADVANVAYSVDGANVTGQVGNALVAGTVYTNAQPNITSVGILSDLTVSGTTDLGSLANVKITGGAPGYAITTDGSGNLSWSSSAGGGTASFVAVSKDSFTGNGVADTFTLSVTPSSVQAIVVNINGIVQLSTAYSLTGADVSFGSAPASGVKIEVTTYGVVSFSGTAGQIQYSNGSGFASSSGLTFNSTTNALSVSGNGTFSGGYLTLDSGIIAVSSGNAGIFTSGIGNVNIGLAGNVTLGGTSANVTARGNFVANTITSNSTISGDTVTATNLRMNDLYSNRTPINVTGTTVIDSFALNKYRTAKYTIRVGSDDGYQSIEVLLIHDAVTSLITVYGSISTSGYDIVLLTSGINSGNVELLATTGSANTTVNLIGTYVAD